MDFVEKELASAFGIGGRVRRMDDPAEKARKAVSRRITDSLDKIKEEHPSLWQHLRVYIRTGTYCSYTPKEPCDWNL